MTAKPKNILKSEKGKFTVVWSAVGGEICGTVTLSGWNQQILLCVCVFLGSFNRRKRNSLYVTVTLLIVSVLILTVGLAATTRTQNVTVGGYYPGVIVSIELLGRSRKLVAYKVPCNAENIKKGDLVLNILFSYFITIWFIYFIIILHLLHIPMQKSHPSGNFLWA